MSIVTLDWRRFGDFSAVGQLTRKIFAFEPGLAVYPVQCLDDGTCHLFRRGEAGALEDLFGRRAAHDAVLHRIRKLAPRAIYVRLSIHLGVLELACKLAVAMPGVPLVLHYMDKPSLAGLSRTRARYLMEIYRFLAARADRIYTIHGSSIPWIEEEYGRTAHVLANFIDAESPPRHDIAAWRDRPVKIHYFGSIDRKMNAAALADVCRTVSGLDWVQLSIWSNSGVWGEVKEIRDASRNIAVSHSNLDDAAFRARMQEADLLLLPYNLDAESRGFLKHSYSNKLVDYLEAGGLILCLGADEIPTVQACRESGLALVFGSAEELAEAFASPGALQARAAALEPERYSARLAPLKAAQRSQVRAFFDYLAGLEADAAPPAPAAGWPGAPGPESAETRQMGFLIRRKLFDQVSEKQSLAASLMGSIIRRKGYQGFDYEI